VAEITSAVPLCTPEGRLNPAAVGWSRRPVHTANLRGWGRTKRFDYWAIVTPDVIVGLTIASLDYAGHVSIVVVDRRTGSETILSALAPLARNVEHPDRSGAGVTRGRARGLSLSFASTPAGTRLEAQGPGVRLVADVGPGADSLGVVVPWSQRRFQYTVKDVGRQVTGTLHHGDEEIRFGPDDGSFAVLDHGRGKWPYSITWNWAAGYGQVAGRRVGLQLGGKWTDGTGSTENGLFVDGRLHKIHEDLTWTYDRSNWMAPWRVEGPRVHVSLAPFHERAERTNLVVIDVDIHQCFGVFTGWVLDDAGTRIPVDGLVGWAEEARNRW
jgi:Domain of unknown function (DUF2804), N-terminal/Domain of unknown function (DUF2804), C-terminal